MTVATLSAAQVGQFDRDGCLLVSGLVPEEVVVKAETALWQLLEISSDQPETWNDMPRGARSFEHPELLACYTDEVIAAAAQLARDDRSTFHLPKRAYVIPVFPGSGVWKWPRPHIDHALKEDGHRTFPRAFRIAAMTYLNDVDEHGGGTVVWPGSHKRLEALARSDAERYATMWALNSDIETVSLGTPLELTPRRGDVLLYHYLCAHSGSMNLGPRPRFAFNMKW